MVSKPNPGNENSPGDMSGETSIPEKTRSTKYDHLQGYCRILGHHVPFSYCRAPGDKPFCGKIAVCWGEKMDVAGFLHENYSPEEIAAVMQPPPPKITTLFDLIQKARSANTPE